jgi:hypothetical protein
VKQLGSGVDGRPGARRGGSRLGGRAAYYATRQSVPRAGLVTGAAGTPQCPAQETRDRALLPFSAYELELPPATLRRLAGRHIIRA